MAKPLDANGSEDGEVTALEVALDNAAPLLRHPKYPDQRRRDGKFAKGNTASRKHGLRARLTLAKRKEELLEEFRSKERDADGHIPWQIDTLLEELADAKAHGRTASKFIDRVAASGEALTGHDYEKGLSVRLGHTARLVALIDNLRPMVSKAPAPFRVFTVSHPNEATSPAANGVPGFTVVAHDDVDAPEVVELLESPDPRIPSMEIIAVKTREQMLRYRTGGDPEADDDSSAVLTTVNKPTSLAPVRANGLIRQWSGRVGSVEPDCEADLLLIRREDLAHGLEVEIGTRVSFLPDGRRAVDVREAMESED
jgi:hypothetical protein